MEMTLVPTARLRELSTAIQRFTGSATTMVHRCVEMGHHFQTEAELFEAGRGEIEALIPGG